jgi:hypothetical protein
MIPDHACVPGLDRPVSVSEYATLKGVKEAEVLSFVRALKIPSAFFRGQWYVEAPPNCEARLAQLRAQQQTPRTDNARTSPQRDTINEPKPAQPASNTQVAPRPQPIDYGLTHDDLRLYDNLRTWWWCQLPNGQKIQCLGTRSDDKYKERRRWFGRLIPTDWRVAEHKAGNAFGLAFWRLLFGSFAAASKDARILGFSLLGVGLVCLVRSIVPGMVIKRLRKRASPALEKYWQALHTYDDNRAAAEKAARAAARDAELRKRSYWAFLDGYAFEQATAEVLRRHQFTAMVTPGSGDGGVDIQVTRNGLKGVVQCKAHVACIGPHVVRDLYGVIYHCGANFGIIVSRGGFTRGAVEFARDKPILFLDTDDLIAMQEGRDVLAATFAPRDADKASKQQSWRISGT